MAGPLGVGGAGTPAEGQLPARSVRRRWTDQVRGAQHHRMARLRGAGIPRWPIRVRGSRRMSGLFCVGGGDRAAWPREGRNSALGTKRRNRWDCYTSPGGLARCATCRCRRRGGAVRRTKPPALEAAGCGLPGAHRRVEADSNMSRRQACASLSCACGVPATPTAPPAEHRPTSDCPGSAPAAASAAPVPNSFDIGSC